MIRVFLILFSVILFYSCKSEVEIPKGIFSSEKMEAVMLDLIKADEIVNQQSYSDSAAGIKAKREILYQKVFQIHKVTRQEFKNSFTFYQNHPDLLKVVLDSMYERAKRESAQDTIQAKKPNIKLKEQALKKMDSIAKSRKN